MKPKFHPQEIAELLRRFMDGQTTLAEEDVQARYFAEADAVPAAWADYKRLFDHLAAGLPQPAGDAQAEPEPAAKPKRRRAVRLWLSAAAVAAVVVVAVVLAPGRPKDEKLALAQSAIDTPPPADPIEPKVEKPAPEPVRPKARRRLMAKAKPATPPETAETPMPDDALLATTPPPADAQTELANQLQMAQSGLAQQESDYAASDRQAQIDYERAMQAIESANIRIDRQRHTLTIYSVSQDGQLYETVLI